LFGKCRTIYGSKAINGCLPCPGPAFAFVFGGSLFRQAAVTGVNLRSSPRRWDLLGAAWLRLLSATGHGASGGKQRPDRFKDILRISKRSPGPDAKPGSALLGRPGRGSAWRSPSSFTWAIVVPNYGNKLADWRWRHGQSRPDFLGLGPGGKMLKLFGFTCYRLVSWPAIGRRCSKSSRQVGDHHPRRKNRGPYQTRSRSWGFLWAAVGRGRPRQPFSGRSPIIVGAFWSNAANSGSTARGSGIWAVRRSVGLVRRRNAVPAQKGHNRHCGTGGVANAKAMRRPPRIAEEEWAGGRSG